MSVDSASQASNDDFDSVDSRASAVSEKASTISILQKSRKAAGQDNGLMSVPADNHVSRATINFWLDALLMVLFVSLAIVATVVQFVFPPGTAAKGWLLWGMNFNQWASVQYAIMAIFGFATVIHVMLHWSWVCTIVTRRLLHQRAIPDDGIQTILGVGLLIGLLVIGGIFIGTAMLTIQMPPQ